MPIVFDTLCLCCSVYVCVVEKDHSGSKFICCFIKFLFLVSKGRHRGWFFFSLFFLSFFSFSFCLFVCLFVFCLLRICIYFCLFERGRNREEGGRGEE